MARLDVLIPLALLLLACSRPEPTPREMVQATTGTLPILITAPHAGTERVPGVEFERSARSVVLGRDLRTDEIAEPLMFRLQSLLGARPYLVLARFDRKYIDANRTKTLAFEDPDAEPYYWAYHEAIRRFVDDLMRSHPTHAILIDLHGHAKEGFENAVCRGTRNGQTVERLVELRGQEALAGRSSILGRLEAAGYTVFPESKCGVGADEGPASTAATLS